MRHGVSVGRLSGGEEGAGKVRVRVGRAIRQNVEGQNRNVTTNGIYPAHSNRIGGRRRAGLWRLGAGAGRERFVVVARSQDFKRAEFGPVRSTRQSHADEDAFEFAVAERKRRCPKRDFFGANPESSGRASLLGHDERFAFRGRWRCADAGLFFDAEHAAARAAGNFPDQRCRG